MDAGDLIELLDEGLPPELVSWAIGKAVDLVAWALSCVPRGRQC